MIPSLRPPAALTALAALLVLGSGVSLRAADDDATARKAAAAELMDALHMEALVDTSSKRILTYLDQVTDSMEKRPGVKPEQVADVHALSEELHTMVKQNLGWDAVKAEVTQVYADDFTEAELKEINAFYHTPVGLKLVDKQPELTEKLNASIQQKSKALGPQIQQKLQAANRKLRPTPPATPMVVPPAAGAPAGSPAASAPMSATPAASAVTAPVAAPTVALPTATPTVPPASTPKPITPLNP